MSVRQIMVLGVALLCAVAALVLVRSVMSKGGSSAKAPVVSIEGPRVLVAAKDIAPGSALQPNDLEWRIWNEAAVSPNFISEQKTPQALEELAGAVARQSLVAGEPIVEDRIVKPGERGFMAAMLRTGFRAVAVPVTEETAASGFILPEDRVDVILTRKVTTIDIGGEQSDQVKSGVVLQDVRVLAIDQTYRRQQGEDGPEAVKGSVALLELAPRDAELLAMADEMGDLSLALRPVQSSAGASESARVRSAALDQSGGARDKIKLHAFGVVKTQDTPVAAGGVQ